MNKIDTSLFSAQEHALDKEYRLCPECGGVLSLRRSKHGLFLGCENYPTCQYMRPLQQQSIQIEKILEHSACPECGQPLAIKKGRFGLFIVELRGPRRSELAALSGDLVGYWRTRTIAVAVELGVFEALPAKTEEIAARCALPLDRTARLLRALAELRLVEPDAETWRNTERGALLTREHPQTLADASREYAGRLGSVWAKLSDALRLGDAWRAPDVFAEVSREDPEGHHRMLRSYARHDYVAVPATLPLRGDEVILDAGGGLGVLAEGIAREWPRTRVVLLDRPERQQVGSCDEPPNQNKIVQSQI